MVNLSGTEAARGFVREEILSRIERMRFGARACASAIIMAVVAACGGGGGGGGDGGTDNAVQPQATIEVTATSRSVQAGAEGVRLSAATTNSNGQVTWTLSGAGTLSASSGQTVVYVPPLPSQLGQATSATITGTVDGVHTSVTIALGVAPGSNWQTVKYPAGDFSGTRYLGGKFYAYQREALLTSTDGIGWAGVRLPAGASGVQDMAYGPQGYVAVANNSLMFSADGVNWSMANVTASNDANTLDPHYLQIWTVAAGNGVFVATGVQGIATSTDGVNWQSRHTTPQYVYSEDIYQITFGAGRFVGVGYGGNYTSVDGVTWSTFTVPSGRLYGVAYGNGMFVAGDGAMTYTSTDGLTWSPGGSISDTTARTFEGPVSFSGGRFFAYGEKGVDSSTDGVHWAQVYTNPSKDINALLTGVASNGSETVITGWTGVLLHGVNDGKWTDAGLGSNSAVNALDCADDVCVAWLANGALLRSTDSGATWAMSNPTGGVPMRTITHGNGLFVAAGTGVVYTSPDGITWTNAGIGSTATFSASGYGAGKFVIAGSGYALFTSSDGINWTAAGAGMTPLPGIALYRLAYGAGRFVVMDEGGNMYTSADASQWTRGPNGSPVRSLSYGSTMGFVGVGSSGIVWQSIDGLIWRNGIAGVTATLQDVAYGNSQYVAVGSGGTVLVSEDAVTWTPRAVDNQSNLSTVRFTGKAFVAAGSSGTIVVSTH